MDNYFAHLAQVNVNDHVERKGDFVYLSWPYAVSQLRHADPTAWWDVRRFDGPRGYLESEDPRRARTHQPVLQHHRHGADGAVAAHREAAARLDKEKRDVVGGVGRGIEHAPRHHVVPARLEHQPGPYPVEFGEEMRPPLAHRGPFKRRGAAGHDPHGVAARMRVDAEKCMTGHRFPFLYERSSAVLANSSR